MMDDKNKKATGQRVTATAVSLAVLTLGCALASMFASQRIGLMATLMMGAIVSLGIGGAFFIKSTWTRIDERGDKSYWTLLDSRLMN